MWESKLNFDVQIYVYLTFIIYNKYVLIIVKIIRVSICYIHITVKLKAK